jgi:hypothetical protein
LKWQETPTARPVIATQIGSCTQSGRGMTVVAGLAQAALTKKGIKDAKLQQTGSEIMQYAQHGGLVAWHDIQVWPLFTGMNET